MQIFAAFLTPNIYEYNKLLVQQPIKYQLLLDKITVGKNLIWSQFVFIDFGEVHI